MPVTHLVFVQKKPGLPFDDFVKVFEEDHMPLLHRLVGDTLPESFRRIYVDPSKPTYIGPYRGIDLVMEQTWNDDAGPGRFMAKLGEGENAKVLQDNWEKYCDGKGETVVGAGRVFGF